MATVSVSIIGSFRKYYNEILIARKIFEDSGIQVLSPKGTEKITDDIPFVRFESDNPIYDDCTIQSITLGRLFRSSAVYIFIPNGYLGRTTAYEIGRLIQAQKFLVFSSPPKDLPIRVPQGLIMSPSDFAQKLIQPNWQPKFLFNQPDCLHWKLEQKLIDGVYDFE